MNAVDIKELAAKLAKPASRNVCVSESEGRIVIEGYTWDDDYTAFITDVLGEPIDGVWYSAAWEMIPEEIMIVVRRVMIAVNDTDGDIKFAKVLSAKNAQFEHCNLVYQSMAPETYKKWCWQGTFTKEWLEKK